MKILDSPASPVDVASRRHHPPPADTDTGPGMLSRRNIATGTFPFERHPRDTAPDGPAAAEAPAVTPPAIAHPAAPDLARILPPPEWLTPRQRRLWLLSAAAYRANGLAQLAAEQEAMAELVMTGQLSDLRPWRTWPDRTALAPNPSNPSIEPVRDIASYAKPERSDSEHSPNSNRFPSSGSNPH